jgi:tetratricopeptide (TPR) repeat protein
VAVAALETGDESTAKTCITFLKKKFPKSGRVKRLDGLLLEADGKFEEASEVYEELLKENPSNLLIMKRKVRYNYLPFTFLETVHKYFL